MPKKLKPSTNERKEIATALCPIYSAATAEAAREALDEFAAGSWGGKHRPSCNRGASEGERHAVLRLSA